MSAACPKPSAAGSVQRVPEGGWRQHQRINPDTVREMALCTVVRLEKALEALGDVQGPIVEVLKSELTRGELDLGQKNFVGQFRNFEFGQFRVRRQFNFGQGPGRM